MKYSDKNPPMQCFMNQSDWLKGALKNGKPVGILWHDTGAGNDYIKRYVQPDDNAANRQQLLKKLGVNQYGNDWNHSSRNAGVNAFVGRLADGSVTTVQVGPWDTHAWGCGGSSKGSCNGYTRDAKGNTKWVPEFWIQFEICDDGYKNKDYFLQVYKEACELTAYLCKKFNIDPKGTTTFNGVKVPTILCHQDSYQLKLGSDHSDVLTWFNKYGKTMDSVRANVAELLNPAPIIEFKPGDVVRITGTKYYSGGTIPSWVFIRDWIVKKVNGDRVVIDKSADGKYEINSPIKASDLKLVERPVIWIPAVGDTVKYNGSTHYTNPNATVPKLCKGGLATITQISGVGISKHPYHLKYVSGKGATVYGWVNSGTFLKV